MAQDVTLTVKEWADIDTAIGQFLQASPSPKLAYALGRIATTIKPIVSGYHEQRNAALQTYGKLIDAEKGSYVIVDREGYVADIAPIEATPETISLSAKLKLSELDTVSGIPGWCTVLLTPLISEGE